VHKEGLEIATGEFYPAGNAASLCPDGASAAVIMEARERNGAVCRLLGRYNRQWLVRVLAKPDETMGH